MGSGWRACRARCASANTRPRRPARRRVRRAASPTPRATSPAMRRCAHSLSTCRMALRAAARDASLRQGAARPLRAVLLHPWAAPSSSGTTWFSMQMRRFSQGPSTCCSPGCSTGLWATIRGGSCAGKQWESRQSTVSALCYGCAHVSYLFSTLWGATYHGGVNAFASVLSSFALLLSFTEESSTNMHRCRAWVTPVNFWT
mmetsp:Transcript_4787/g.12029  ORF Transcript_4787/g.12029 Transcript_4787/m.12029 type:complete len:201 (+) Transcript_4787:174-776(+)